MGNTTSVKIVFRESSVNKKYGNLHVRTIENRKAKYKGLGIKLLRSTWDADNQQVLPNNKKHKEYNAKIKEALSQLEYNYNQIEVFDTNNTTLLHYWKEHNAGTINAGTLQLRNASYNKFKSFLISKKIEAIKIHQLTPQLIQQYEAYLNQSLTQRSVNTYIGYLKSVVNKAIKHQLVHFRVNPFINHKRLTNKHKKVSALTINQIKSIMEVQLNDKHNYYRNMFLFQLLGGGYRVKDLITLKWGNFIVNDKGVYINLIQKKTRNEITTNLSIKALGYLDIIMQEFEPNKMDYVITEHEYLNTLIGIKKDREEVNGEYKKYRNERVKTDYVHYDYILKENIKIDAITSSEITELTLNQDIKRYHQIVIQEYGKVINSIIASHSDKYIFNKLMKDLEIPINNTNLKLDYLLKYRIQKYNKHLKEIANIMEIKPFTSHQARHSFAQLLVNNNTNLYYVQQAMGHGNLGSTKNYLNSLDTPHLDNITTNLGNMFN